MIPIMMCLLPPFTIMMLLIIIMIPTLLQS